MTTHVELPTKEKEEVPKTNPPEIQDALDILLMPYDPADDEQDAEKLFSTNEIIASLERHYGVLQGTVDYFTPDAGFKVVARMKELGFKFANTGELELQWLLKRKK